MHNVTHITQAVLFARRKPPAKQENVVLPALSRRRKSFEQKNLPSVPEVEKKAKVLPSIESKSMSFIPQLEYF